MDLNHSYGGDAAASEAAFVDGSHPALAGNATAMDERRRDSASRSSRRSVSPVSSTSFSPRFTARDPSPPTHSGSPPRRRPSAPNGGASNTGPKGVLADWQALNESGVSATSNTGPKGVLRDYKSSQQTRAPPREQLPPTVLSLEDGSRSDDEDRVLTGDEAARELYRRQRLNELRGSGEKNAATRRTFGHLREVGLAQFVGAVENEADDVAVVVHLYEPDIDACAQLNSHLSSIARSFPRTKFLRALATELDFAADSEEHTLPTILVYRGGELETTLIRFDQEWGKGTRSDVVKALMNCDAVSGSPAMQPRFDHGSGDEGDDE